MIGAAGPPRRHDVTLALYNNTGLILGIFIILCAGLPRSRTSCKRKKGARSPQSVKPSTVSPS